MSSSYKLVGKVSRPEGTTVAIRDVVIGGPEFVVAAGPCAVESKDQLMQAASGVAWAGARLLRTGAFKPRTSPYAFQGLGEEGLRLLSLAGRSSGLPTVTEVLSTEDIPLVAEYADAFQVGARNMQNFALLKALGGVGKPIILKRGLSASIDELLMAAEYILLHGNPQVALCERGIRTFETATRNTLDLNAVALLKQLTHLPVIVDPSHGTGRRELITAVSRAAVAVGADGLLIEVHPAPDTALSDGAQSITPGAFADLMCELAVLVPVSRRQLFPGRSGESRHGRIASIDEAVARLLRERDRLNGSVPQAQSLTSAPCF